MSARSARWVAVVLAMALIGLPATEAAAGSRQVRKSGHAPVGEKVDHLHGRAGTVYATARTSLEWSDNFTYVRFLEGFGESTYCAPGDCEASDRPDPGRPADALELDLLFVVEGKEVSITKSSGITITDKGGSYHEDRSETTGDKTMVVTFPYKSRGPRSSITNTVADVRVDGKGLTRADFIVRATAEKDGQNGVASAHTITYLR